jgi:hypothetical protein
MIKFNPYVVTFCSLQGQFDFEPMRQHIRTNLEVIEAGGHVTHVTVAIVPEYDDCQPMIERLKKILPYKKTGYTILENIPKCGLSDLEKTVLGVVKPTVKIIPPNFEKMTEDERAEYCEENFDLEFPDDHIDDPLNRY